MNDTEPYSENYYCKKVEGNVSITGTNVLHRNSATQQIDKRLLTNPDCDSTKECGVQDETGEINWNLCIHPVFKEI